MRTSAANNGPSLWRRGWRLVWTPTAQVGGAAEVATRLQHAPTAAIDFRRKRTVWRGALRLTVQVARIVRQHERGTGPIEYTSVEPFPPLIPPKVRDQRRSDRSGRATHAQRGARFDGVADRRPRTTFGWDGGCVRFRTRKSSRFEGSALTSRRWRRRPQRTCDRCDAPGSFALCGSLWWFARRRTAVAHIEGCTSTRVGRLPPTTPAAAVTAGKTKAGANVDSPWPQPPPTPLSPHFVLPPNSCQPSHHPFPLHRCSLDRCPAQRASRGAPTGAGHGVAGVAAGLRRSPRHQRLRQLQLWGAKTTKKARGGARVPGGRPSVLGGSELCISKI